MGGDFKSINDKRRGILRRKINAAKASLRNNPIQTQAAIQARFGLGEKTLRRAVSELASEDFDVDVEARKILADFYKRRPGADYKDAAAIFQVPPKFILFLMSRNQRRGVSGAKKQTLADDVLFKLRVMRPAEYVCDVLKRGYTGVSLPPEEFSRYLDLYNRKRGGF